MEIKTFSGTVDLKPTRGRFSARICRFGVADKTGDVVRAGAFAASLARWRSGNRRIPVIYNHVDDDPLLHIGSVNPHNCMETSDGLVIAGQLYVEEERGAKVYELLKHGALAEWSYGCWVQDADVRPNGRREFTRLELFEVSPTLIGKGDSETLMVASAIAPTHDDRSEHETTAGVNVDEQLAPYRARLAVAQRRIAAARATRPIG
jgi:HK97 family phage prohead protease